MIEITSDREHTRYMLAYTSEGEGDPIGSAMIERYQGSPLAVLWSVKIESGKRDRGEGSQMIGEIIAHCEQAAISRLSLDVETDNKRAIHVYDKIGFYQDRRHCEQCDRSLNEGGDLDCDRACEQASMIRGIGEGEQAAIASEQAAILSQASESGRRYRCKYCHASEYMYYDHHTGEHCEDCGGELKYCPYCGRQCKQCEQWIESESEG